MGAPGPSDKKPSGVTDFEAESVGVESPQRGTRPLSPVTGGRGGRSEAASTLKDVRRVREEHDGEPPERPEPAESERSLSPTPSGILARKTKAPMRPSEMAQPPTTGGVAGPFAAGGVVSFRERDKLQRANALKEIDPLSRLPVGEARENLDVAGYVEPKEESKRRWEVNFYNDEAVIEPVHKGVLQRDRILRLGRRYQYYPLDASRRMRVMLGAGVSYGDRTVVASPLVAASGEGIIDKSSMEAWSAIQALFGQTAVPYNREFQFLWSALSERKVNTMRLSMRMAVLMCAVLHENERDARLRVLPYAEPDVVRVENIQTLMNVMNMASNGSNFVPYQARSGTEQNAAMLSFLKLISSNRLDVIVGQGDTRLSFFDHWPEIPGLAIVVAGDVRDSQKAGWTAMELWTLITIWSEHWGDVDEVRECMEFLMTMCLSHSALGSGVMLAKNMAYDLPPYKGQAYSMCAVLEAPSGSAFRKEVIPDWHAMVGTAVVKYKLLHLVHWNFIYKMVIRYYEYGLLTDDEIWRVMMPYTVNGGKAEIWDFILGGLRAAGVKGDLGRIYSTLTWQETNNSLLRKMVDWTPHVIRWGDMVRNGHLLVKDAAIWGFLYPLYIENLPRGKWMLPTTIKGDRTYEECLYSLFGLTGVRTALYVKGVNGTISLQPWEPAVSVNNDWVDYAFKPFVDRAGNTYEPIVQVTDKETCYLLESPDHVRYQLTWFLNKEVQARRAPSAEVGFLVDDFRPPPLIIRRGGPKKPLGPKGRFDQSGGTLQSEKVVSRGPMRQSGSNAIRDKGETSEYPPLLREEFKPSQAMTVQPTGKSVYGGLYFADVDKTELESYYEAVSDVLVELRSKDEGTRQTMDAYATLLSQIIAVRPEHEKIPHAAGLATIISGRALWGKTNYTVELGWIQPPWKKRIFALLVAKVLDIWIVSSGPKTPAAMSDILRYTQSLRQVAGAYAVNDYSTVRELASATQLDVTPVGSGDERSVADDAVPEVADESEDDELESVVSKRTTEEVASRVQPVKSVAELQAWSSIPSVKRALDREQLKRPESPKRAPAVSGVQTDRFYSATDYGYVFKRVLKDEYGTPWREQECHLDGAQMKGLAVLKGNEPGDIPEKTGDFFKDILLACHVDPKRMADMVPYIRSLRRSVGSDLCVIPTCGSRTFSGNIYCSLHLMTGTWNPMGEDDFEPEKSKWEQERLAFEEGLRAQGKAIPVPDVETKVVERDVPKPVNPRRALNPPKPVVQKGEIHYTPEMQKDTRQAKEQEKKIAQETVRTVEQIETSTTPEVQRAFADSTTIATANEAVKAAISASVSGNGGAPAAGPIPSTTREGASQSVPPGVGVPSGVAVGHTPRMTPTPRMTGQKPSSTSLQPTVAGTPSTSEKQPEQSVTSGSVDLYERENQELMKMYPNNPEVSKAIAKYPRWNRDVPTPWDFTREMNRLVERIGRWPEKIKPTTGEVSLDWSSMNALLESAISHNWLVGIAAWIRGGCRTGEPQEPMLRETLWRKLAQDLMDRWVNATLAKPRPSTLTLERATLDSGNAFLLRLGRWMYQNQFRLPVDTRAWAMAVISPQGKTGDTFLMMSAFEWYVGENWDQFGEKNANLQLPPRTTIIQSRVATGGSGASQWSPTVGRPRASSVFQGPPKPPGGPRPLPGPKSTTGVSDSVPSSLVPVETAKRAARLVSMLPVPTGPMSTTVLLPSGLKQVDLSNPDWTDSPATEEEEQLMQKRRHESGIYQEQFAVECPGEVLMIDKNRWGVSRVVDGKLQVIEVTRPGAVEAVGRLLHQLLSFKEQRELVSSVSGNSRSVLKKLARDALQASDTSVVGESWDEQKIENYFKNMLYEDARVWTVAGDAAMKTVDVRTQERLQHEWTVQVQSLDQELQKPILLPFHHTGIGRRRVRELGPALEEWKNRAREVLENDDAYLVKEMGTLWEAPSDLVHPGWRLEEEIVSKMNEEWVSELVLLTEVETQDLLTHFQKLSPSVTQEHIEMCQAFLRAFKRLRTPSSMVALVPLGSVAKVYGMDRWVLCITIPKVVAWTGDVVLPPKWSLEEDFPQPPSPLRSSGLLPKTSETQENVSSEHVEPQTAFEEPKSPGEPVPPVADISQSTGQVEEPIVGIISSSGGPIQPSSPVSMEGSGASVREVTFVDPQSGETGATL